MNHTESVIIYKVLQVHSINSIINNKVITENKEQTQSYLALITAVKITLRNALELIGVSAPEKM